MTKKYLLLLAAAWSSSSPGFCAAKGILDPQNAAAPAWQQTASTDSAADQALIQRDLGRLDESLSLWKQEKAPDGFSLNQQGWAWLSLRRYAEAREAFLKAAERSATSADQAEAGLGLGLAARLSGAHASEGLAHLRQAMVQSPSLMAAVSYEMAKASERADDSNAAAAYFQQCSHLDALDLECLKEAYAFYARAGMQRAAWQTALRVAALDPEDGAAARLLTQLAKKMPGGLEASRPLRRLTRPVLPEKPSAGEEAPPSAAIRVALFSDADGRPAALARIQFIANSGFKAFDISGAALVDETQGGSLWEIAFRDGALELRDPSRNIRHSTRRGLRLVPGGRQGSILLKGASLSQAALVDAGDREVRGAVEALPAAGGIRLVNELGIEEYLYGVVSIAFPHGAGLEAYKAQAVVSRTRALWEKAHHGENPEKTDTCDSEACQKYLGVSEEMREAALAVRTVTGVFLASDGAPAFMLQHEDCGGRTEDGREAFGPLAADLVSVFDAKDPQPLPRSPRGLERWTHEAPPPGGYDEAGGLSSPSQSRWMRLLPAADLAARAERIHPIGALKSLRAAQRTSTGRILSLEVSGSKDRFVLEGEKAVVSFLSPGSLRSTLFTIQPLMGRGKPSYFILWGAGTGHGIGFCRAGALGQAKLGRTWEEILAHDFPKLKISKP